MFEGYYNATSNFNLSKIERNDVNEIIAKAEEEFDDDGEGIITDARYTYISELVAQTVKKGRSGLTASDKADRWLTNRFFALPIFAVIMFFIYWVSVRVVGGPVTDWVNDVFFGEIIGGNIQTAMEGANVAPWLISLVVDGIVGGVGAVLGFLPIIATLYLFMAILEDVGYMSRIAFILDRIFSLSCQYICYTYERVFQNACYFIENYKWISQGVKLCVP